MTLSSIIPSTELSDTEIDIIIANLTHPSVQKYLKLLALNDTKELLSLSAIHNTDDVLIKALAVVQGKIQVIETLLSIQERESRKQSTNKE